MEEPLARPLRAIKSFVLRTGRLTQGQQLALDHCWPKYGLEYDPQQCFDFAAIYGNAQPVWLEIGFGNGEALTTNAANHPENNYLGIEVHTPGVGQTLGRIEQLQLTNVRLMKQDAVMILRDSIPDHSLSGVQLFFPDPWHKNKHKKRRILNPDFVPLLAAKIKPGGIFHAATDWEDYAKHMLRVMAEFTDSFTNIAGDQLFVPRPPERPLTKFEQRGNRLGHGVWDMIWQRR